jgi:branched-chain amino acid transport system substrate-binding protein
VLGYRAAYEKTSGGPPTDSFSAYGFDGWLVLADAAKRALATGAKPGTVEFRKALRDSLMSTKDVIGTHGVYTFSPNVPSWVDERARVMVKIEGGAYKLLN